MRIHLSLSLFSLFFFLIIVPEKNEYSLSEWEMNTKVCWAWLKVNWKSQRYCFGVILLIQHLFICLLKKWWRWNLLTYFLWRDSNIQFRNSVIHLKIEKQANVLVIVFHYSWKEKLIMKTFIWCFIHELNFIN